MKRLRRKNFILIAAFVVSGVMLAVAAWYGEKSAAVLLCFFLIAVVVLQQLGSALTDEILEHSREVMDYWKLESDYANSVADGYLEMVRVLYEHDPVTAEVYQDRFTEALKKRAPEIALALADRSAQAEKN